jgi:DNA-binding beta-propeller fold protein YncE
VTDYQDQYGGANGGRYHKVNLTNMTSTKYDASTIAGDTAGAVGPIKFNSDGTKVLMYGGTPLFNLVTPATNARVLGTTGNSVAGVQGFSYRPGTPSGGWLAYGSGVINFSEAGTVSAGFGFPNPVAMTGGATDVAFSLDGTKVYCAARGENSVKVINGSGGFMYNPGTVNIPTVDPPWIKNGTDFPLKLVMSPTLPKLYLMTDYSLQVIETNTNTFTKYLAKAPGQQTPTQANAYYHGGFRAIAVNNLGTKVYVAAADNVIFVFDTATETWEADIRVYPAEGVGSYATVPTSIAVSPDSTKLYVVNRYKNTVSVIA